MATRREQAIAAIVTALTGTVQVGARIYRSRVEPLSRGEAPAIVVGPGPDRSISAEKTGGLSMCKLDHRLMVAISVYARGTVVDQLADPIEADVHRRLMTDRTLGGIVMDVVYRGRSAEIDPADQTAGWMTTEYEIRYRTSVDDLELP